MVVTLIRHYDDIKMKREEAVREKHDKWWKKNNEILNEMKWNEEPELLKKIFFVHTDFYRFL